MHGIPITSYLDDYRNLGSAGLPEGFDHSVFVYREDEDERSEVEYNTRLGPLVPVQQEDLGGPGADLMVLPLVKRAQAIFTNHLSIGRTRTNDLQLDHHTISKFHAYITSSDSGFVATAADLSLSDAGSKNGTLLDGTRLEPRRPHPLHDGAAVVFGGLPVFRFHTRRGFLALLDDVLRQQERSGRL